MRLIDADAIYDAVERRYKVSSGVEHRCERDFLDLICSAETVDAVEVVHGRWENPYINRYGHPCHFCSVCGFKASYQDKNYCPDCGARMDGEGQ